MPSCLRKASKRKKSSYSVYVVELDRRVYNENWKFRQANPQYNPTLQCLYVGMSSTTPQVRLLKHKTGAMSKKGHKISSYYVERYGKYLRPSLYSSCAPKNKAEALKMEDELGRSLRRKGYAVWWN